LVPLTDNSGNFNSTNNLWSPGALNETPGQVYPTLASAISQLQGATGFTAASFNATDIDEGAWDGSATISLPSLAPNTIVMAFVEDANGNLVAVTPWSSSFAVAAPEPGTIGLLGVGAALAGLAAMKLRRS